MDTLKYEKLTLTYDESETLLTVTDCEKDAVEVFIPEEVNGLPVIAIGDNAFNGCDKLVCVTVPDNADYFAELDDVLGFEIGDQAFAECKSLKNVDLPFSVSSIGHGAFRDCEALEEIVLPDCYIGPYAFYRCYSLKKVNPIDIISEGVFSHCKSLSEFPVKEGTPEIGEDAFEHCYALTEAVIPASVKRIEQLAFRNCHNLKTVTFEEPTEWYSRSSYTMKDYPIDVLEPEHNAAVLRGMDFDDGCGGWFRMTESDSHKPQKSLDEIIKEIEEWQEKNKK